METPIPFPLMVDTLTDATREAQAPPSSPRFVLPSLKSVLSDAASLPAEALFLGLAEDGLPVLLNLYDPVPGPVLITGDRSSGKTCLLQMIANATNIMHTPAEVQFCVITAAPRAWDRFQNSKTNAGIYPVDDPETHELLQSLVTWAHNNKGDQQSIVLMFDSLEDIKQLNLQAEQNLRWLLLRGPSRRVWPILTLNADCAEKMADWMGYFRTRLFSRTHDLQDTRTVSGKAETPLGELTSGMQFAMREGENWLTFWCPSIE